MGKFNFGVDAGSASEAELGDGFYAGPTPPKGVYTCVVKKFSMKKNKNDDFRLSVLLEIQEEDGSENAIYNGYGFFGGYNVNDQGKPWINNMLDGIGAKRKDFWDEKITTTGQVKDITKDTAQDVLKIGLRKTTGHIVRVACKLRAAQGDYEETLEPQRFITDDAPASAAASALKPDEEAGGLDEGADTADDTQGVEPEAASADGEGYTEEELSELDPADLKEICDSWEITYAAKATKATLVKLILKAQNEPDEDEAAADEDGEEAADDTSAAAEQSATNSDDNLTEEELEDLNKEELIEYMTEKGWDVPKPAIPSRMRKSILEFQASPPF